LFKIEPWEDERFNSPHPCPLLSEAVKVFIDDFYLGLSEAGRYRKERGAG
jgi:hypothetical protein